MKNNSNQANANTRIHPLSFLPDQICWVLLSGFRLFQSRLGSLLEDSLSLDFVEPPSSFCFLRRVLFLGISGLSFVSGDSSPFFSWDRRRRKRCLLVRFGLVDESFRWESGSREVSDEWWQCLDGFGISGISLFNSSLREALWFFVPEFASNGPDWLCSLSNSFIQLGDSTAGLSAPIWATCFTSVGIPICISGSSFSSSKIFEMFLRPLKKPFTLVPIFKGSVCSGYEWGQPTP